MSDSKGGGTYFLGRYRVVDEIGIGGMASVHLARMDGPGGFQRWAAIKKIHSHLIEDDSFIQMFLDEAQVAARISHPNVAQVFDLGKTEDTYWIAMEYLHGEPLREVMRRTEEVGTAMPPEIACKVIADAAEGLHAAHDLTGKNGEQLNLVHRDVTPHNLFVTYDGITKVLDFGIAKFSSRAAHTKAGTLKGKLAYMSPEQVHGEQLDRRTDVFALGVVLWELTTGRRLFRMESDLDTLAKVQECDVPRPSALIRGYPIDLEKIVMKALAKNRNDRFKTAKELSRSLQQLLMRRGLFIASDEVAQYVGALFQDRMRKRDEHLKWASEVTQTVNIDGSPPTSAVPKAVPERESSDVQRNAKPLPAAGAPAAPRAVDVGSGRSSNAAYGQPMPAAAPPRPQAAAPKPAAAPPQAQIIHDVHPADADGPTIQADVDEPLPESGPGEEPPTMMAPAGRPAASPAAPPVATKAPLAPLTSSTKAPTPPSPPRPATSPPPPLPAAATAPPAPASIPTLDDGFEDQEDATIVQMGATGASPTAPPPAFPPPAAPSAVSRATAPGPFKPASPVGAASTPPPPLPNKMTMPLGQASLPTFDTKPPPAPLAPSFEKAPALFGGDTMALGASANPAFLAVSGQNPVPSAVSTATNPYDFSPQAPANPPMGLAGMQAPTNPSNGQGPMGPGMQPPMMSPFGPNGQGMGNGQMDPLGNSQAGPMANLMGGQMGNPQMGGQMGNPMGGQMGNPMGGQMGNPMGGQMGNPQMGNPMGGQMGNPMAPSPFDFGGQPPMGQMGMDSNGQPMQQQQQGGSRMAPTMPAMRDMSMSAVGNGSVSMVAPKKRAPMWVIAAISCAVVLLVVAVVLAVVTRGPSTPKTSPSATPSASVAVPTPTEAASVAPPVDTQAATAATAVPVEPAPTATVVAAPTETAAPTAPAPTAQAPTAAPTNPPPTPTAPTPTATPKPSATAATTAKPVGPTPVGPSPTPAGPTPAAGGPGTLTVVCFPKCEEVRLDGAVIASGNVYNKEISAGNHSLALTAGGKKKSMSISVKPGESKAIRESL